MKIFFDVIADKIIKKLVTDKLDKKLVYQKSTECCARTCYLYGTPSIQNSKGELKGANKKKNLK